MEKNVIIIANPGSASKKYAAYMAGERVLSAHFEHDKESPIVTFESPMGREKRTLTSGDYENAFAYSLDYVRSAGVSVSGDGVAAVGVRVVAPGMFFTGHRAIDTAYVEKLTLAERQAPLHIRSTLAEIEHIRSAFPKTPLFGISDSAFHADMPSFARLYAIPHEDADRLDVYRFGYHGISVASVIRARRERDGADAERVIVCHLGGGSSITAVRDGKSVDTSMGFTPDEGVPMTTRVGNIGAGAVSYIAGTLTDGAHLERYFNEESGLLGVSGSTGDIRELLLAEESGDERARDALQLYVYAIRKHIGAFATVLGGVDTIILTGTIGERSSPIRSRICSGLEWLGVEIDEKRNGDLTGEEGDISTKESSVIVSVIRSREMDEMSSLVASMLMNYDSA